MWDANLLVRLLLPVVLIGLLGISPQPHAASNVLRLARISWEAEEPASAAKFLAQAAEYFPWQPKLWETAGRYALQARSSEQARQYLTTADARGALTNEGILALGDVLYEAGDIEPAVLTWKRAPPSPELYNRLVIAHRYMADYQALIEDYQALLSYDPNNSLINYQLGLLYAANQPENAFSYLQIAGALNADYTASTRRLYQTIRTASLFNEPAYTYVESGRALAALGEWELAAQAFYQAVNTRPDFAEAWAFLGEARQHQGSQAPGLNRTDPSGDQSLSLQNLEQALQIDPESVVANSLLGLYWQRRGNYDQAFEYLSTAVRLDPLNPAFQAELGNCIAGKGDLNSAVLYYQHAVNLAPQDSTYWRILALFSLKHQVQLRDIGLAAARQAVILSPSDPLSLDLMGQVFSSLGDYANAERFFQNAINVNPDFAPAHLHYGINYLVQGDTAGAYERIRHAYLLSPDSPIGQQAARILERYFP